MTPDSIMPIASISKVLIGISAAQAMEDGVLDIEQDLTEYLSIPFEPADGLPRTFRQLATHTAGIEDSDAGYEEVGYHFGSTRHPVDLSTFLTRYFSADGDLYAQENFAADFDGQTYSYSNVASGLAGQALTDATGEDFASYSTRVAIEPLGLSGAWGHIGPPADVTLYERDDAGAHRALMPYALATWPDGQFNASARDLAKMMATVLGDGVFEGETLLAPSIVERLVTPLVVGPDGLEQTDFVGLFWTQETLELGPIALQFEGHSGGDPGIITFMYRLPDSPTAFVLMMNGEPRHMRDVIEIFRLIRLLSGMPSPGE